MDATPSLATVFLHQSIPMLNPRRRALTSRLAQMGAHVATSMGDTHITHVVVHTDTLGASAAGLRHFLQEVNSLHAAQQQPPTKRLKTAAALLHPQPHLQPPTPAAAPAAGRLCQVPQAAAASSSPAVHVGAHPPAVVVSDAWLEESVQQGRLFPSGPFQVALPDTPAAAGTTSSSMAWSQQPVGLAGLDASPVPLAVGLRTPTAAAPAAAGRLRGGAVRQLFPDIAAAAGGGGGGGMLRGAVGSLTWRNPLAGAAAAAGVPAVEGDAKLGQFAPWLGSWTPAAAACRSQVELVLQGTYNRQRCRDMGNGRLFETLRELMKYEEALGGNKGDPGQTGINHEALNYAHAAAAVCGCSFPLTPSLSPAQLQRLLPFAGKFTATIIHSLLATGTCQQLEDFRADRPAANSRGDLRRGTEGAATRRRFVQLPGVGAGQALKWWQLGYRTYEELEAGAAPGGPLHPDTGDAAMSREALYCLQHRDTLLQAVQPADVAEMRRVVLGVLQEIAAEAEAAAVGDQAPAAADSSCTTTSQSLNAEGLRGRDSQGAASAGMGAQPGVEPSSQASVGWLPDSAAAIAPDHTGGVQHASHITTSGSSQLSGGDQGSDSGQDGGWVMQMVGGGRRSHMTHDADFLITHPSLGVTGLVWKVYTKLVDRGVLVPQDQGLCRIQSRRMGNYLVTAKTDILNDRWTDRHQMDRYDHIWGVFITGGGKRCRMDLMFIPPEYWTYALVGWTGSKQWLRFLRQHAGNCGMFLNSHFLFRRVRAAGRSRSQLLELYHQQQQQGLLGSQGGQQGRQLGGGDQGGTREQRHTDQQPTGRGQGMHRPLPETPAAAAASSNRTPSSNPSSGAGLGNSTPGNRGAVGLSPSSQAPGGAVGPGGRISSSSSVSPSGGPLVGAGLMILQVPEEAPPADSIGNDYFPPGWLCGSALLGDTQPSPGSPGGAATGPQGAGGVAALPATGSKDSAHAAGATQVAKSSAPAADQLQQGQPAQQLQQQGHGLALKRHVVEERDLLELLRVPWREAHDRDC